MGTNRKQNEAKNVSVYGWRGLENAKMCQLICEHSLTIPCLFFIIGRIYKYLFTDLSNSCEKLNKWYFNLDLKLSKVVDFLIAMGRAFHRRGAA